MWFLSCFNSDFSVLLLPIFGDGLMVLIGFDRVFDTRSCFLGHGFNGLLFVYAKHHSDCHRDSSCFLWMMFVLYFNDCCMLHCKQQTTRCVRTCSRSKIIFKNATCHASTTSNPSKPTKKKHSVLGSKNKNIETTTNPTN